MSLITNAGILIIGKRQVTNERFIVYFERLHVFVW